MRDSQQSFATHQVSADDSGGRPVGAMIIAVLAFLAIGVVLYNLLGAATTLLDPAADPSLRGTATWLLPLSIVLLPLLGAIGVGLWRQREWGRKLAVIFLAVSIISVTLQALLTYNLQTALMVALVRNAIPATLMGYLLHPSIRASFRR
jgi:hypothetical protein